MRYRYRNDCPHVRRRHLIFSRYRYALSVFPWWACLTWILDREMEQEQTVRVVVQIHYILQTAFSVRQKPRYYLCYRNLKRCKTRPNHLSPCRVSQLACPVRLSR